MDKQQLKTHIENKKKKDLATGIAKNMIASSNYVSNNEMANRIYSIANSNEILADVFFEAAVEYANANPMVDPRMEAGKQFLICVAGKKLNVVTQNRIPLTTAIENASCDNTDFAKNLQEFVDYSMSDKQTAANALMIALRTEHPTLCADFLNAFMTACYAMPTDSKYLKIACSI